MFAGKTAISSAISPQPAGRRSQPIKSASPPAISHAPLTATSNPGTGSTGGTICR